MRDCVHQSLENCLVVVLGSVNSALILSRCRPHVPENKTTGFGDLLIQGTINIRRIELIRLILEFKANGGASIGNSLNVGIRQPATAMVACHKDACHSGLYHAILIRRRQTQLAKQGFHVLIRPCGLESPPKIRRQIR